jgi:hypothetical protein
MLTTVKKAPAVVGETDLALWPGISAAPDSKLVSRNV